WQGEGGRLSSVLVGVLLALGAGASYAVYTVASKELLDGRSPEAVVAVVFGLGALLLSPVLFMADLDWLVSGRGLAVALHLGILTVAVAYLLFARGLAQVRVATATTLTLAEPLTAATLGVVVLGERLGAAGWLGAGLLLGGLCVLFSTKDK
ncbi:MAG: EamA family transporter, partial [Chloroflexota bacterium]